MTPTNRLTLLARNFKGYNKSFQALSEQYSADTTDCRYAGKIIGSLGPRLGRTRAYTKTHTLLGFGILRHSAARYAFFADDQGAYSAAGIDWPGLGTPANNIADSTGHDTSARVRTIQFFDRLYISNGRDRLRCLQTSGFSLAGIDKAEFTPTVANNGGTGPSGTYTYYVVPANRNKLNADGREQEGIPAGPSAEITVADDAVRVGAIPATHDDPQVTHWNIYRNKNGVLDSDFADDIQDFFFVGSVDIGTTHFDDDTIDDDLDDIQVMKFNQNYPGCCKIYESFGGRLFGAGFDPIAVTATVDADTTKINFAANVPDGVVGCLFKAEGQNKEYQIIQRVDANTIKLSEAFIGALAAAAGTIFRKDYEIDVSEFNDAEACGPEGRGLRYLISVPTHEGVVTMKTWQNMMLVFTATAIFAVQGQGPRRDDIKIVELYRGIGCVSPDCCVRVDNEVYFLSKRGPAVLAGGEPQLIGRQLNSEFVFERLTSDQLAVCCMGTDDEDIYLSVPAQYRIGSTETEETYRFDRSTETWWPETEMHPFMFVRCDADGGFYQRLHYIQGRFVIASKTLDLDDYASYGAQTDIVAADVAGGVGLVDANTSTFFPDKKTITNAVLTGGIATLTCAAHGFIVGNTVYVDISNNNYDKTAAVITAKTTNTFSYAVAHVDIATAAVTGFVSKHIPFTTTGGALEQCYIRFYDTNNVLKGRRRILSNTAYSVTWSNNDDDAGGGEVDLEAGDTWEIGPVMWRWTTREVDVDAAEVVKRFMEINFQFALRDDERSLWYRFSADQDGEKVNFVTSAELVRKSNLNARRGYLFAAELWSRDAAILIGCTLVSDVGADL